MSDPIVKLTPAQEWWCSLTNKKRRWYSIQPSAFAEVNGVKTTLTEREIATAAYAAIKRERPP